MTIRNIARFISRDPPLSSRVRSIDHYALVFLDSNPAQVVRIQNAIAHLDVGGVIPGYLYKARELLDLCGQSSKKD